MAVTRANANPPRMTSPPAMLGRCLLTRLMCVVVPPSPRLDDQPAAGAGAGALAEVSNGGFEIFLSVKKSILDRAAMLEIWINNNNKDTAKNLISPILRQKKGKKLLHLIVQFWLLYCAEKIMQMFLKKKGRPGVYI
uniref:Uncharacterized protein n=1 Tax=Opuntia streptacantha TaxID=393608 RepID=A0A7C9CGD3_OPUST